jgi:alkyl hydroperoxide reductase subunit D
MATLAELREALPEAAKDLKLNLDNVLEAGTLSVSQVWGTAVACAIAARNPALKDAVLAEAAGKVSSEVIDDAKAAAALMGMNNVFYRFRHMVGKDAYTSKPARLRMQRIARPLTSKADFELFCLAVSAVNGCEACIRSHEKVVLEGGLTEDHVFDAARIAATLHGVAVALEI